MTAVSPRGPVWTSCSKSLGKITWPQMKHGRPVPRPTTDPILPRGSSPAASASRILRRRALWLSASTGPGAVSRRMDSSGMGWLPLHSGLVAKGVKPDARGRRRLVASASVPGGRRRHRSTIRPPAGEPSGTSVCVDAGNALRAPRGLTSTAGDPARSPALYGVFASPLLSGNWVRTCLLPLLQADGQSGGAASTLSIVCRPDSTVRESRDRVPAAIRNSGPEFPIEHITVPCSC
jgi:hypothetical protein